MSALMDNAEFRETHALFHRLWSKAVGTSDYVKAEWKELDNAIAKLARAAHEKGGDKCP